MSKCLDIVQGVAYALRSTDSKYFMAGSYAYYTEQTDRTFEVGEGIPGQVAKDKKILFMDNVPEDYIRVVSGLGNGSPRYLMEVPLVFEDQTWAVLELASFDKKDFNYDYCKGCRSLCKSLSFWSNKNGRRGGKIIWELENV